MEKNKIDRCFDVTGNGVVESKSLSNMILGILISNDIDCSEFDYDILETVLINAYKTDEAIELLLKCIPFWEEHIVMKVLAQFKSPYCDIASYKRRPKITKNNLNLRLVKMLKEHGYISSEKIDNQFIRINTWKSEDHLSRSYNE